MHLPVLFGQNLAVNSKADFSALKISSLIGTRTARQSVRGVQQLGDTHSETADSAGGKIAQGTRSHSSMI